MFCDYKVSNWRRLYIYLVLIVCSSSCTSYENWKQDSFKDDLCELSIVTSFTAKYRDPDSVSGLKPRTCPRNDLDFSVSPRTFGSRDLEIEEKTNAVEIFSEICENDMLYSANLVMKGKHIGVVSRECSIKTR